MSFPMVALGKILTPVSRPESVDPEKKHRILGAHWYSKGLYIKDIKLGSEIQANKVYRVEKGDFVYNRLFAWKGSFAVATNENHGCYVSNEFPCFKINSDLIDGHYLWLYFSRAPIWEEALGLSTGGTPTSRNRLKEEKFLAMQIPLPPLSEQRRIVARIQELAAKIEEARGLRRKAGEKGEALIKAAYKKIFENLKSCQQLPLNKITTEGGQQIQASQKEYFDYPYLSLENIEAHSGRILEYRTCQEAEIRGSAVLFRTNDVLYSKLRPYLNKVVTPSFEGCATTELVILRPDATIVDRNYLAAFLRNPQVVKETVANSAGTKMPRTNMKWFRQLLVPLPPLSEQRRIVAYLDALQAKVNTLRRLQAETSAELDALLPAVLDRAFKGEL